MTSVSPDKELIRAYVTEGSDAAFRALAARHVNLVFATALRQVGDAGIAEEITQNVFVALARKAPRLAGVETLAGWLHRTAILEAKARIRAELRRRRREEKAIELASLQHEGTSPLDAMTPLLDEGLMHLRENDRLALVMRFLEDRSLRDVGTALGVDEDAARKRVSRALARLAGFFRECGFAVPATAGSAVLFANAAQAAPAGLAASASNAGLAAGGTTGFNLLWFHVMALTKTQTAVICLVLAAAPLALQYRAEARAVTKLAGLTAQLEASRNTADELEQEARRARETLLHAQNQTQEAELRLAALNSRPQGQSPRPRYHWDDSLPFVRVPKQLIAQLSLDAVRSHRGQLSDQIKEVLQMNATEESEVQAAIDRFLAGSDSARSQNLRPVSPTENELQGHKPEEVRAFEVPGLREQITALRQDLLSELEGTLGAGRFQLFRSALKHWMPVEDDYGGLNSSMAVFNFDHRALFFKPQPGTGGLDWELRKANGEMMSLRLEADEISPAFRPHLQDWITLAESQPAGVAEPQKK